MEEAGSRDARDRRRRPSREEQMQRREFAEELELDRRQIEQVDGEFVVGDEGQEILRERDRQRAAEEINAEIDQLDIRPEDLDEDEGQWMLGDDRQSDLESELRREARREQRRQERQARREAQDEIAESVESRFGVSVDRSDVDVDLESGDVDLASSVEDQIEQQQQQRLADRQRVAEMFDRSVRETGGGAAEVAEQLDGQSDVSVDIEPTTDQAVQRGRQEVAGTGAAIREPGQFDDSVRVGSDDVTPGGRASEDVLREVEQRQQQQQTADAARDIGVSVEDLETVTIPEDDPTQVDPQRPTTERDVVQPTEEAREDLIDEQRSDIEQQLIEEEGLDPDEFDITEERGRFEVNVEPEERDSWVGRRLQGAADRWDAGAAFVGTGVESVVPSFDLGAAATTPAGTTVQETGVEADRVTGQFVRGTGEVLNPPGIALFAGDVASGGAEIGVDATQARGAAQQRLLSRDPEDITERPFDVGADIVEGFSPVPPQWAASRTQAGVESGLDALVAGGASAASDPAGTTGRAGGFIAGGLAGGPAIARGGRGAAQRARQLDDFDTRQLAFARDDRAQLDLQPRTRDEVAVSPRQTSPDFDPRVTEGVGRREPGRVADADALTPDVQPGGPRATLAERQAFAQQVRQQRAAATTPEAPLFGADAAASTPASAAAIERGEFQDPEITAFDDGETLDRQEEDLSLLAQDADAQITGTLEREQAAEQQLEEQMTAQDIWTDADVAGRSVVGDDLAQQPLLGDAAQLDQAARPRAGTRARTATRPAQDLAQVGELAADPAQRQAQRPARRPPRGPQRAPPRMFGPSQQPDADPVETDPEPSTPWDQEWERPVLEPDEVLGGGTPSPWEMDEPETDKSGGGRPPWEGSPL